MQMGPKTPRTQLLGTLAAILAVGLGGSGASCGTRGAANDEPDDVSSVLDSGPDATDSAVSTDLPFDVPIDFEDSEGDGGLTPTSDVPDTAGVRDPSDPDVSVVEDVIPETFNPSDTPDRTDTLEVHEIRGTFLGFDSRRIGQLEEEELLLRRARQIFRFDADMRTIDSVIELDTEIVGFATGDLVGSVDEDLAVLRRVVHDAATTTIDVFDGQDMSLAATALDAERLDGTYPNGIWVADWSEEIDGEELMLRVGFRAYQFVVDDDPGYRLGFGYPVPSGGLDLDSRVGRDVDTWAHHYPLSVEDTLGMTVDLAPHPSLYDVPARLSRYLIFAAETGQIDPLARYTASFSRWNSRDRIATAGSAGTQVLFDDQCAPTIRDGTACPPARLYNANSEPLAVCPVDLDRDNEWEIVVVHEDRVEWRSATDAELLADGEVSLFSASSVVCHETPLRPGYRATVLFTNEGQVYEVSVVSTDD